MKRLTWRTAILGPGAAAVLATTGCPLLEPDEDASTIALEIVAVFEPGSAGETGRGANAPAICPDLEAYGPDAALSARTEIRRAATADGRTEAVLAKAPLDVVWEDGGWIILGDVTFLRGAAEDEYELTLELLLQGTDADGTYSGTIAPRELEGLDGCVRSLAIDGSSADVEICTADLEGSRQFFLSDDLTGTYRTTVRWPPGSYAEEEVLVTVALDLLPVRIAVGASHLGPLTPGRQEVTIFLASPPEVPRCPGDPGEELDGTIVWSFDDQTIPDAIGDVLLVRDADCSCCSECGD